jgi:hypothetical protein
MWNYPASAMIVEQSLAADFENAENSEATSSYQ